MKKTIKCIVLFFVLVSVCLSSHTTFSKDIIEIVSSPKNVKQYEVFKLISRLPYFYENPYDSDQVRLDAGIILPNGKKVIMPAFCSSNDRNKDMSTWEVRFTPQEEGRYKYSLKLKSSQIRTTTQEDRHFDVKKSNRDGFLRKSNNNPYYFKFDSGKPFFGIGHSVAWVLENKMYLFEKYFSELEENKCNLTRVWSSDWTFPIEWETVGKYNQEAVSNLDELFELAEKKNIYFLFCLDTYGSFMVKKGPWGEQRWEINPYNKKNGGPCRNPEDFFTNAESKRLYKNKLRYIVARWGYSTNILAIELLNEYNAPKEWTHEMAKYIKSINPHGQNVTISHGFPFDKIFDDSVIWKLDTIDFVTFHNYGDGKRPDLVPLLMQRYREFSAQYKKPMIASEFGIDSSKDDKNNDAAGNGIALHNSIWASAVSKSFGTAMNWWWDKYISPKKLQYHYRALANFLDKVNWDAKEVEYVNTSSVMLKRPDDTGSDNQDVIISPQDKWGKIHINEFTISNDGDIAGAGTPNKYLHGTLKKNLKVDHIFNVDYAADGRFVIHIGTVSQGGNLRILLDGKETARKEFLVGSGKGPWKESKYLVKYKVYQCVYDEDFAVKIPRGKHQITLTNTGKDWIGIEKITLENYIDSSRVNARCLGLSIGEDMLIWIQNKDSNWKNNFKNIEPGKITDTYFEIFDIEPGIYTVEWWDTFKGKITSKKEIETKTKILRIDIPDFSRDIACKIRR